LPRPPFRAIADEKVPKGEVLNTARIAGIMAAKRCGELIPPLHPLGVESIEVHFDLPEIDPVQTQPVRLHIKSIARITAKTGVEMEALTAVSVAALTIYDMCKAIDKQMVISDSDSCRRPAGSKAEYGSGFERRRLHTATSPSPRAGAVAESHRTEV